MDNGNLLSGRVLGICKLEEMKPLKLDLIHRVRGVQVQ